MTTTTNIGLDTPSHGADVDTWDQPLNGNATIIDACFGTVTSKALTNVNVTMTVTELQASVLRFSGAMTGNVLVNVGAAIKSWFIDNQTTGSFVITFGGGFGRVVGVPQGETTQIYYDGSHCNFINLGRIGSYLDDCGATVPAWITACSVPPYLLCDGNTFNGATYPYLAARLGTTTLPDFRGRMPAYLNGGTARITTAGSGVDGDVRFSGGGSQARSILRTNLPAVQINCNGDVTDTRTWQGKLIQAQVGGSTTQAPGASTDTGGTFSQQINVQGATPTFSGLTSPLGDGTGFITLSPTVISGIRMIRAA